MKGSFVRRSPASFATKVGIPAGWFVISWAWMPDALKRRRAHGRWYRIKSDQGTVHRILRFSGNVKAKTAQSEGSIVIDWPAWLELNGYAKDVKGPVALEITENPSWKFWVLVNAHPDPTYRLAAKLGLASVLLGIVSLVLGLWALCR